MLVKKNKIKVVHIITTLGFGGAERLLFDFLKYADKKRFDFQVIALMGGGQFETEIKKLKIPVKVFSKKTKLGLGLLFALTDFLKKVKPDIVHTHLFAGDTWGRLAAIMAKVPHIVSTEHNTNFEEGNIKVHVKKILSDYTDRIIAVSSAVLQYSVDKDNIDPAKMVVIHNGVDFSRFPVGQLTTNSNKKKSREIVFCSIGRLEAQKGQKYLIQAAIEVIKKHPAVKLWIVGDGSLRPRLEQLVASSGMQQNISFLGHRHDVPQILAKADYFVFPSVWEGFGIVVLEAAMAGKPIIATKIGGIPEIIIDRETGLLVKPRSASDLKKAMLFMIENKQQSKKYAIKAKAIIRQRFDIKQMAKDYESLYSDILNKKCIQ